MTRNKLLIIGTGTIVGIAVIAALIFLYATVWSQPTKKDFTDAKTKAEKITTYSGTKLLQEFSAKIVAESKAGKTQAALADAASTEKKKTTDALDARLALAEEIESSRVVRDDEVGKVFDTYIARENRYATYIRDYTDGFPLYVSSLKTCTDVLQATKSVSEVTKIAAAHKEAATDCLQDLGALESSGITPFADFAKEFKRIVTERQKIFDGIANKQLNADSETSGKIVALSDDFAKIDPTEALQKYGKDAVFNGELNKLIDVLDKKVKSTN